MTFEPLFEEKIHKIASLDDPAHDLLHVKRVVKTAKNLCEQEGGNLEIVIPAAWLHDLVIVPKNDPNRSMASRLSAKAALQFLKEINYPEEFFPEIAHAIEAHSFSANIEARTKEAKIVQDADRLDGLGAIGIARCFATGALFKRPFYAEHDPFCEQRLPDDRTYTLDHFYQKLFKIAETLHTAPGRKEGARRVQLMHDYLHHLAVEID